MNDQKYDNTNRCGLFLRESKNNPGMIYYGGKVSIGGKEYWVSQFDNDKKPNPNSPERSLVFNEVK